VRLYIAGPPVGDCEEFHAVVGKLRDAGFLLANAHCPDPEPDEAPKWGKWMRRELGYLLTADGIALLPGTGGRRGVALLVRTAHELAIPIRTVRGWQTAAGQRAYMQRLTGET
jgi:hypothetical protein